MANSKKIYQWPILGKKIDTTTNFSDNFYEFINTSNSVVIVNTSYIRDIIVSFDGYNDAGIIPPTRTITLNNFKIQKIAFKSNLPVILYLYVS